MEYGYINESKIDRIELNTMSENSKWELLNAIDTTIDGLAQLD